MTTDDTRPQMSCNVAGCKCGTSSTPINHRTTDDTPAPALDDQQRDLLDALAIRGIYSKGDLETAPALDVERLARALHEPYGEGMERPPWGSPGRCRACGEDGVWSGLVAAADVACAYEEADR